MNIKLYQNASEPNRIIKALSLLTEMNGNLREGCSIERPVIQFDMSVSKTPFMNCNYAYIQEFGRYYFITDKNTRYDDIIEISMKVDVLMSFSDTILNTEMLIDRSEEINTLSQPYIVDNQRPAYNYPMVLTKAFSSGWETPKYYLTVANSQ